MSKNYVVDTWSVSDVSTSLKNKTTIGFMNESIEDLSFKIDTEGYLVVSNGEESRRFTNYSSLKFVSLTDENGTTFKKDIVIDNYDNVISTAKKGKISGTKYSDMILGTDFNDKIFAGAGDDIIHSSLGNDTIKGGAGENTVIYTGEFGTDTIVLSKNEKLNIDLSAYSRNEYNIEYSVSKKDMIIEVTDRDGVLIGTIKLQNFVKSNVVGKNGCVNLIMDNKSSGKRFLMASQAQGDQTNSNVKVINLNNENLLAFDETNFSSKGKFVGTRFSETIDATYLDKGANINAGAGYNIIYGTEGYSDVINCGNGGNLIYTGSGKKSIKTGSGDDTIVVYGEGAKTIKAGKGENVIEIENFGSSFGDVVISEEKVSAKNTVIFYGDISNYTLIKNGNDLIISDAATNSSLTLKSYYLTGNKYAQYVVENQGNVYTSISDLIGATDEYIVSGKGTITGTSDSDIVIASDALSSGKASNDKVKAGKGDDIINAGRGSNSIFFYEGDGNNTVVNGGGTDTLVFSKGTKLSYSVDGDNLVINYGKGNDSVTIENYFTNTSVKYVKVGSSKYNISSCYKMIERGAKASTINVSSSSLTVLSLRNTFDGTDYTYEIKSNSKSQKVKVEYLENGRLVITGNHLSITAANGQNDDVILLGSNNTLNTEDGDDVVRVGYAMDASGYYYCKQSDNNKINTGNGDDHVVYYGLNNKINTGNGKDSVMSAVCGTNMKKEGITNSETSLAADQNSYNTFNNEIDWFSQGYTGGDCRLFALLKSLSMKSDFSLKDYVTITEANKGYNVTFNNYKGSNNSCYVATSALKNFGNVYGDIDVVLVDYALNKLLAQNQYSSVQDCDYNDIAMYMFGKNTLTVLNYFYEVECFDEKLNDLWNRYSTGEINNLTVGLHADDSDYKLGLITGHAYTLAEVAEDYVVLINPWDSDDRLTMDMGKFYDMDPCVVSYGNDCYDQWILFHNYDVYSSASDVNGTDMSSLTEDVIAWTTQGGNADYGIEAVTSANDNMSELVAAYVSADYQTENILSV